MPLILLILLGTMGRVRANHLQAAGSATYAKQLREKLFATDGYDKKVRPSQNYSEPTEVYVSFHLRSINGLDESTETLTTTGYIYVSWFDSELAWNMTDFGNISYMYIPQNDVWKPDIALENTVKPFSTLGLETLNVFVESNGYVYWYPFQMFESYCAIDITHFPFDEQTCEFNFVAWSYAKNDVSMAPYTFDGGIDMSDFDSSSQWSIIGSDAKTEEDAEESHVIFTLKLKRKPRFILLSVILPTIMLSILSVLTFLLPCGSGEKASYAVTVFLSFSLFLTIVSSSLPQNSDTTSLFSIYLVIQTAQSTLITIIAMVMIRVSHFEPETRIPKFLVCLARCLNCHSCSERSPKISPTVIQVKEVEEGFESLNGNAGTEVRVSTGKSADTDWKGVVNALDICFLIFFILLTVITTVICLGIAASNF